MLTTETIQLANADIRLAVPLLAMLAVATFTDLSRHRIPNGLSIGAAAIGLVTQAALFGPSGVALGLLGLTLALICFLPFYIAGGMAAGDVKLMAAVGAFLGPIGGFAACLATLVAGALLAGGWIAWKLGARALCRLAHAAPAGGGVSKHAGIAGARIPYAAAIAGGTSLVVLQPSFVAALLPIGAGS